MHFPSDSGYLLTDSAQEEKQDAGDKQQYH
jgi:hypothetical protein